MTTPTIEEPILMYEGKAKRVYQAGNGTCLVEYKDDATAFNGAKRASIAGKGHLNNSISAIFMAHLAAHGVPTHFIEVVDEHRQLVHAVEIVPLEVVVRNVAAGSLAKRVGLEEGTKLPRTVVEFYYKDDDLGDPLLNRSHIAMLGLADEATLSQMEQIAVRVNELLQELLLPRDLLLVDYKLEFGTTADGQLLLADEISPDTCRFWDANTMQKLDKDRFRRDLGDVTGAYEEVLRRLQDGAA